MAAWWESLTALERAFACAAIPATLLLAIQTVMLLFGLVGQHDGDLSPQGGPDGADISASPDGGYDIDFNHDGVTDLHTHDAAAGYHEGVFDPGLRLLTVRGLIAFFAVGGWTGLTMLRGGISAALSTAVALCAGLLSMAVLAWMLKLAMRLQSDGTTDIRNAIGVSGSVYIPIPSARADKGKVMLMLQGKLTELDAVTDAAVPIKTGAEVQVLSVTHGNTLVVAPGSDTSFQKSNSPKGSIGG